MPFSRRPATEPMTQKKNISRDNVPAPRPFIPPFMGWVGPAMLVAGLALMQRANVALTGALDGMWYAGLGLCVAGVFFWLTAGMTGRQVVEWVKGAGLALACALVIRWAIAEPYRIPSSSMETTLHGDPRFGRGDRVFVNKWIYGIRVPFMNRRLFYGKAPERWDIVVFKSVEPDAIHKTLVKRIVGMPGERVLIRQGKIYVNGSPLPLPDSLPPDTYYTSPPDARYGVLEDDQYSLIPPGHYLVLGDNSAHSRDGRYFGWLPNEHIVGRVACIWWPPTRWRDFTGFSRSWWWRGGVVGNWSGGESVWWAWAMWGAAWWLRRRRWGWKWCRMTRRWPATAATRGIGRWRRFWMRIS